MAMTPKTGLAEKTRKKHDEILKAGLNLFAEKGFHGTAVPEVAVRAGVGTGTIYRYFESKEILVNWIYRHSKRKLKDYLMVNVDLMVNVNLNAGYQEIFHQFWMNLVRFAQENPIDFRFLELQDHVPYLDAASRAIEMEVLGPIWAFCIKARAEGIARDMPAEMLMAMIWGAFVGIMKAQDLGYIMVDDEALKQAEQACWDMFDRKG